MHVCVLCCDCSNLMGEIELQCPKSKSLRLMHSRHKHTHAIREPIWDSKLKRLNHSNSLTTNKHNNTLWYPRVFRCAGLSCTRTRGICFMRAHRANLLRTAGCKWAAWSRSVCRYNNVNSWITVTICHQYYCTVPSWVICRHAGLKIMMGEAAPCTCSVWRWGGW